MQIKNHQFPFLVSGKFGDVVGRVVNGKQFFSKLPSTKKRKPTMRVNCRRARVLRLPSDF